MNKKIIYITTILLTVVFSFTSCFEDEVGSELVSGTIQGETKVFQGKPDSINYKRVITKDGLTTALDKLSEKGTLGQLLQAQFDLRGAKKNEKPGPHAYQYKYSLKVDQFAGYFSITHAKFFGGYGGRTYYKSADFDGGPLGAFLEVKNTVVPVLNHPEIDSIPEIKAIALLVYNYAAQEVTDIYGPFPYNDFKQDVQKHPFTYNSVEAIYKTIISNIDTIVACLDNYKTRPDWYKAEIQGLLSAYDYISPENKEIENWKRFANSLKLRMAMHTVKVVPKEAKKWAEEAIASGVIEDINQEFMVGMKAGFSHPLLEIANSWNDTRLNASLESILNSYNHPYLSFVFDKNSHPIINLKNPSEVLPANSKIVGLRTGIKIPEMGQDFDSNPKVAYSSLDKDVLSESPMHVMSLSEVCFLRAEGAIRGWNMGGTAEQFYTEGIVNAFKSKNLVKYIEKGNKLEEVRFDEIYGTFLNTYLAMEKPLDYVYKDPSNDVYDLPSYTKIGVKWNNGDDNETKLEKIMTQKYIAQFPNSFEAWTDIRRTGYPRIFPVFRDTGDGSIPAGDIIRRIPFVGTSDPATQTDINDTGLEALGGPDMQGTRLWWDVLTTNF